MASSIVSAVDGSPLARSAAQLGSDLAMRLRLLVPPAVMRAGAPPGPVGPALARAVDARMVVSGTRGHGPLRARLSNSSARLLLTEATAPVVVCAPRMAHRTRVIEAA